MLLPQTMNVAEFPLLAAALRDFCHVSIGPGAYLHYGGVHNFVKPCDGSTITLEGVAPGTIDHVVVCPLDHARAKIQHVGGTPYHAKPRPGLPKTHLCHYRQHKGAFELKADGLTGGWPVGQPPGALAAPPLADVMGDARLEKALKHDSILTSHDLHRFQFGELGKERLTTALEHNSTLTSAELRRYQIGGQDTEGLQTVLGHYTSMTSHNLHSNRIGALGAARLATAIEHNCTLKCNGTHSAQIGGLW